MQSSLYDSTIIASAKAAHAVGSPYTVSVLALLFSPEDGMPNSNRVWEWAERLAVELKCDVAYDRKNGTVVFIRRASSTDHSTDFRKGFEAAKNAAIRCARQVGHYNLREPHGCKAIQLACETMMLLDADRFNEDGSLKPEPTVEYDARKHGPIANGRVQLPIPAAVKAAGATHEMSHPCGDCLIDKGRSFCIMNCGPRVIR